MTTLRTGALPEVIDLHWCAAAGEGASFLVIGDVRDVLYSRADLTRTVPPQVTHGFGLLSDDGAPGSGEGIVLRGFAALTPPGPAAGRLLRTTRQPDTLETPFFLGWSGEPSAIGRFRANSSLSLNSIFESIFQFLDHKSVATPLFSLELLALFRVSHIQDRALRCPVHAGNVLITEEDQAARYFRFGPIRSDLGGEGDPMLALAIAGVGFRPSGAWDNEMEIADSVFYKPPKHGAQDEARSSRKVRTHSHALAWSGAGGAIGDLQSALANPEPGSIEPEMNRILSGLLQAEPSHLVHLDDWSSPLGGLFRVFVPQRRERFQILHP